MRKSLAVFILYAVVGLFCTSTPAQPPLNAESVIKQAAAEEAKVRTGSLVVSAVTTHTPQSEAEIRRGGVTGTFLVGALQIERETPPQIKGQQTLLFDNPNKTVLIEKSDDFKTVYQRIGLDQTLTQSYRQSKDGGTPGKPIRFVPNYAVSGPMPTLNDGLALLVCRFWQSVDTATARLRQVSADSVIIELPPLHDLKRIVELDPKQNYAVQAVTILDVKTGRVHSTARVTRTLRNGTWFVQTLTQTRHNTSGKVEDETVTTVQSASLNVPVTEKALAFGDVPNGTVVTDFRVSPSLTYVQGAPH